MKKHQNNCEAHSCHCSLTIDRRGFIGLGLGTIAGLIHPQGGMAGPFSGEEIDGLVPEDKKLLPDWIKSLTDRGTPTLYQGESLEQIGMPVGGLCAGQLYLGGDGRLWHWDLFNMTQGTGDQHYVHPRKFNSSIRQGFVLRVTDAGTWNLDHTHFPNVTFRGEYPVGTVEYQNERCPIQTRMEAFSPFIPLNTDDSSLPATVFRFTLTNPTTLPVEALLVGILENAVCHHNRDAAGIRGMQRIDGKGHTFLEHYAKKIDLPQTATRPDLPFEDWNKANYDGWTVEGQAFGKGPILKTNIPAYQGDVGGDTTRVVNSHATAPGNSIGEKDNATGKLTSKPFAIVRNYIRLWVGGGDHKGKTCVNLVVDGQVIASVTGPRNNRMVERSLDARQQQGKTATLEIVDGAPGDWSNIGVGRIWFSDSPSSPPALENLPDHGTMGLALLGPPAEEITASTTVPLKESLVGELGRKLTIPAGESREVFFVLSWHFPNLEIPGIQGGKRRYYATRFASARAVVDYVAANRERLVKTTLLWRDTWYDSTLPYWFLDRTFINTSILASSTCHRFADGRFYGWEGVGCCPGTCTHVWHYAQAVARIFPELERILRERVDFGLALRDNGLMFYRGEAGMEAAIDGQAGTILRAYREHQMSADDGFLKRNYKKIKKALFYLIQQDNDSDGIITGPQLNTLDAYWFGAVAWLSGLYLAALRAGEEMAREAGDIEFAKQCRDIFDRGTRKMVAELFEGEYFINKPDPNHPEAINSGSGCEIDQVLGQSWGFQVGLGRILPQKETLSALRALWRYNFTPNVGPFREANKPGRWYAMPGEAGLLMCTFPRKDWNFKKAAGKGDPIFVGYFNECMNGFEHQVAGHMIWEGMVQEGLAIERAIHDRYHGTRRNPWNEIECGDHYARSMASFGVFLAACGHEYHGPKQEITFAPRLTPDNFRAPFTTASGWGTFHQQIQDKKHRAGIDLKYGSLKLKNIRLGTSIPVSRIRIVFKGEELGDARVTHSDTHAIITLLQPITLVAGDSLQLSMDQR